MNLAKITATIILITGLAGCGTAPPVLEDGESIVRLHEQVTDEMLARRLDMQRAENLTYFKVSPGAHTMELGVVTKGYQESQNRCVATISYDNFVPNEHYTLMQSSAGREVKIQLMDSKGNTLAQTDKIPCL
ncbi:hypothetical protein KVG88_13825 [Pseudomonas sp. SWRI74]|uniref:Lipoprotein n=1 Tax=Pseudomonas azerbaijanoccidentalis TaxID=2842347 RepID=A0ABS6QQE5_9PSED|nr:hypothetical protein [Pseudomonas azerbaijanoccidentalis]MBV4521143.1 hypothetical protein [Pseudomonas azerbaijanoccidentalis]